jgi:hypothetical protein
VATKEGTVLETRERSSETAVDDSLLEIRRLEELWAASTDADRSSPLRRLAGAAYRYLGFALVGLWLVFLVSVFFMPAPNPNAATPAWADLLIAGFFLTLVVAAVTGMLRSGRGAYAASTLAGALGVALAVGCKTTAHHPGGWWAYELGATAVLLGLSALGLRRSNRPS